MRCSRDKGRHSEEQRDEESQTMYGVSRNYGDSLPAAQNDALMVKRTSTEKCSVDHSAAKNYLPAGISGGSALFRSRSHSSVTLLAAFAGALSSASGIKISSPAWLVMRVYPRTSCADRKSVV